MLSNGVHFKAGYYCFEVSVFSFMERGYVMIKYSKEEVMQFVQEEDESQYMGFASFAGMQGAVPAMKHLCFAKIKESLATVKKMASTGDEQTRQHYQMLIFNISKYLE